MGSDHGSGSSKHLRTDVNGGEALAPLISLEDSEHDSRRTNLNTSATISEGKSGSSAELILSSSSSSSNTFSDTLFEEDHEVTLNTSIPDTSPTQSQQNNQELHSDNNNYLKDAFFKLEEPIDRSQDAPSRVSDVTDESLLPMISSMQSPTTQLMERNDDYDPSRIPSSIFTSKSSTPVEWSIASNESLFSIHVGNHSFSRDHIIMMGGDVYKSGELEKSGELMKELYKSGDMYKYGLKKSDDLTRIRKKFPTVTKQHKKSRSGIEEGKNSTTVQTTDGPKSNITKEGLNYKVKVKIGELDDSSIVNRHLGESKDSTQSLSPSSPVKKSLCLSCNCCHFNRSFQNCTSPSCWCKLPRCSCACCSFPSYSFKCSSWRCYSCKCLSWSGCCHQWPSYSCCCSKRPSCCCCK